MSRAVGRGGLAHPPSILVVFVAAAREKAPADTTLNKWRHASPAGKVQLFPTIAIFTQKSGFLSFHKSHNLFKSSIKQIF